jgi:hypothetical protein
MVEYGSKTGRRAMQLELLTRFFGHWVRVGWGSRADAMERALEGADVDGAGHTSGGRGSSEEEMKASRNSR